jgi:NTP pyrophosphatase (non-canonical NTP hydrolase)
MRISEAQDKAHRLHNRICAHNNQIWLPVVTVVDILEEAGEEADAVKNLEGYSPYQQPYGEEKLAAELADLMWSVLVLATTYNLDMEKAVGDMLTDNEKRFIKS